MPIEHGRIGCTGEIEHHGVTRMTRAPHGRPATQAPDAGPGEVPDSERPDTGSERASRGAASTACRTLDTDLEDGRRGRNTTRKRVCIATPDVVGAGGSGGIGAAYRNLAQLLAEQGHEVVIACVNDDAADERLMEEARARHAGLGVALEPVVPRPAGEYVLGRDWAPTWALLDWLRACAPAFDIVHVPDWQALGYGSLLAKSLGLAFEATHFVVLGASPTLWRAEGDRRLVSTERELGWAFMERRSAELADTFICTSGHLLEWMHAAGYALPARSFVWPCPSPAPERAPATVAERAARDGARLEEVVFFGRLEWRKGLLLFLDAVDRLVRQGRAPSRVTFLGGVSEHMDGPERIRNRSRGWPIGVRLITDPGVDEAVAYLARPGRLAVMPSLRESASMAVMECLQAGIPFLAAATGGTPELVALEDHAHALVAPDHVALGERIAELADSPLHAVRPRRDLKHSLEVWSRWHVQTKPFEAAATRFAERARAAGAETPLVTVCVVHHERPELVRMAVDSVFAQDYPALEAILVDDGSESAEARAALDALEDQFGERGWRVIRQENRYLGAARNAAVAAARGDWVLFLDDDNLLFPDAVSRLVRAARFANADCVPAASVPFFGDGDPRTDSRSHGAPIRFLGAARTLNLLHNVAGDAFALVRRNAFDAIGGFTEEYGVALEDMELCNRLMRSGLRIEPLPDPAYYYRIQPTSMINVMKDHRIAEVSRTRMLAPRIEGSPAEDRAFMGFAIACISDKMEALRRTLMERDGQIGVLSTTVAERNGQIAAQHIQIGALSATVAERDGQIAAQHIQIRVLRALSTTLAERDGQIGALSTTLAERDGQIRTLSTTLAERDGQIGTLSTTLAERDGQIGTLSTTLAERDGQIGALSTTLSERDGQIGALSTTLAERDGQIGTLSTTLAERDGQIGTLSTTLAERDERIAVQDGRIGMLNETLVQRDGRIAAMLASTSWRLTRPLREVKLVLAGSWLARNRGVVSARRGAAVATAAGMPAVSRATTGTAADTSEADPPAAKPPWASRIKSDRGPDHLPQPGTIPLRVPLAEKDESCPPLGMLVRDFHDGGLEKLVVDLAKQFLKRGIVCTILVAESGGRAMKLAEDLGCRVRAVEGDVERLVSAVREEGIRAIIAHHCYEPLERLSKADVKIVEVMHNAYSWQRDVPYFLDVRARCVDRFIAVSDFVRDYALASLSVPDERIRVIENGLSRYGLIRPPLQALSRRRKTTVDRPLLVHLANAHPQKNHIAILRALESILPDFPGARLVLAGVVDDTTDVGRQVRAEIARRDLHGRVRCSGPLERREVSRLLADAHIGLLPSVFEGFSIGSLEYAYFGLPTVLSDTGAARRLRDRYGHVVLAGGAALPPERLDAGKIEREAFEPDSSTVAGIASAIREILANYDRFADSGQQAGMDWESYSIEKTARRYRDLLVEVVA